MSSSIFEMKGVSYAYQQHLPALTDIDLTIFPGEQLALLGANGCGKTTLLFLLDGLLFPSAGKLSAFGEPLEEEKLEQAAFRQLFRGRVGMVFQNPDIQLFCPTVYEEIAFGPLQLDLPAPEVRERVEDLLAMFGIAALRDRSPGQLSGGEQKKVAIASVLAPNPAVLLLDEPTNGLDPRTQGWLTEFLMELAQAGKTIITATHDLNFAGKIAARTVVLAENHRVAADCSASTAMADRDLLLHCNLIHAGEGSAVSSRNPSSASDLKPPFRYPFTAACKKRRP